MVINANPDYRDMSCQYANVLIFWCVGILAFFIERS
jgi:hypothetical protein